MLNYKELSRDSNDAKETLFLEGNIPTASEKFEVQHECNYYCQFFKLPSLKNNEVSIVE